MADEGKPPVWGLWNTSLGEWWNPGTRKPFYADEDAAARALPKAGRQYSMGRWEVREYPLTDEEEDVLDGGAAPSAAPESPGVRAPVRSETAPEVRV